MKKFFIYLALLFSSITLHAQTIFSQTGFVFYNSNQFSINNYSPFTMPYSLPTQQEGYAQLNDSSNNCVGSSVIFSSNGINVYDGASGVVVASGLLGQQNSTNAATIVPISGSRALIITTKGWNSATNEAYSSILNYTGNCSSGYTFNMPLATKNVQLIGTGSVTNFSEKVTVMPILGSTDYWLLMHEATNTGGGSNRFLVFRINYSTGVIAPFASYNVGLPVRKIGGKGQLQAILGQDPSLGTVYYVGAAYFIKPSSMGGAVDVLIMNPTTSALTLKETITSSFGWNRPYGLEFSRSSKFLFVGSRNIAKTIFRYDPYAAPGSIFTTITPSGYGATIPNFRFGQLQRTDNDAIYTPLYNTNRLLYIPVSSSPASFPFAPPSLTISNSSGAFFKFGLSNYWRT